MSEPQTAVVLVEIIVGTGRTVAVTHTEHADEFVRRYLAVCWPTAEPEPYETAEYPGVSYRYHRITPGHYSGGEILPVEIRDVAVWTPDQLWPRPLSGGV